MSLRFSKQIRGLTFYYPNEVEFRQLYEEIFKKHVYYVELDNQSPLIIDGGAHVGLASIYFKTLYPNATIWAFEPLPELVEYLQANISVNRLENVFIIPSGLAARAGKTELYIDAEDKNHWLSTSSMFPGAWTSKQQTTPVEVETVELTNYLEQPVDILKLDIEGAEIEVINSVRHQLKLVKHLFLEFHATRERRPQELVTLLLNAGFELTIYEDGKVIPINRMTRRKPTLYLIEGHR